MAEQGYTKGVWEVFDSPDPDDSDKVILRRLTLVATVPDEANAHLIASAVNACIKLNPDNPQAVAESITDLYGALKVAKTVLDSNLFRHPDDAILQLQCGIVDKALSKAGG